MGKLPNGEVVTDEEFARRPQDWPTWPMLPLKRWNGHAKQQIGMLVEMPTSWIGEVASGGVSTEQGYVIPTIVFLGNVYDGANLADRAKVTYGSMEGLFADGWVVD